VTRASFFRDEDGFMTKSVISQYVAALTPIAVVCLLAFVSIDFSPALAAMFLQLADLRATLATVRSAIGPICASGAWLAQLRACEGFFGATVHPPVMSGFVRQ
jgi:hypothetical protein